MPSQAILKKIAALKLSKYRQKYGQFTVEGRKGVDEVIHSRYKVHSILATSEFAEKNSVPHGTEIIPEIQMKQISQFATAPGILALAETLNYNVSNLNDNAPITLCLDGISDPGNLGTIIRTADWFGINQVVLSTDCTDFYNAKTLSSTMGSFTRCVFVYTDLAGFLKDKNSVGCFLSGTDVNQFKPKSPIFLVVGSESHGIRDSIAKIIREKITIPGYGKAESLNAGIAAGIVMEKIARFLAG
jgi:TrmH family RNA methyltransferase